jgi:hypothetical protein
VSAITGGDAFEAYMAARFQPSVWEAYVEPQESLGEPAAVATPGPRLRTSAGRLYAGKPRNRATLCGGLLPSPMMRFRSNASATTAASASARLGNHPQRHLKQGY